MLKWILTGGLIPPVLLLCGVFFLVYLRGYPFRAPTKWGSALRASEGGGVSSFRALMQALAGTLGVGNVVGVANAIAIGGAGAMFWMWISALLAMILKYAEILLAVAHRRMGKHGFFGGAVYYIRDLFDRLHKPRVGIVVSVAFAVLMLVNAVSMGCVLQVNAVSEALRVVTHIPPWLCGTILLCLTLPLLLRGSRGISALTEYLVPIMTLGYVLLSLLVLLLRREEIPTALLSILRGAFCTEGVAGGVIGFLSSRALRVGTMRGLLSNEAGCGTAPTAHAQAQAQSPAAQGIWGILEVFVDTILLCTATALVILVGKDASLLAQDGILLTIRAYESVLGGWASYFLAAAVFCFGYATLLCWGGYGLESLRFLTHKKGWGYLYCAVFSLCILLGAYRAPTLVWDVADFSIAALTTLNLFVLLFSMREIRRETFLFCKGRNDGVLEK